MFGLVKASRLRDAEADLRASKVRSGEWENLARDNQRECQNWEQLKNNWRAIAESRLVAVLLLRDRWDKQYTMADAAIRMDHAHVRNYERTIEIMEKRETAIGAERDAANRQITEVAKALTETGLVAADKAAERDAANRQVADQERTIDMMDERFNELTAKWETATAAAALNAAAVDTAQEALSKFGADLTAISSISFTLQPEIETAIIRPSSTNRLRWRVNDDDGKALCQSSTGYATSEECTSAFARAAFLISLDYRAPEDDRIGRIREVLTLEPDTV